MSTSAIIVIVVVAVVVLLLIALSFSVGRRRHARRQLQQHFGPEYDRTVGAAGDSKLAEAELRGRLDERERLELRPLRPAERDRYLQEWYQIQTGFVDQPRESLASADRLVTSVMRDSGYPMDDFDHRADLVSVDHPDVVQHYRSARQVQLVAQRGGQVSTEDVRQAVVSYRWLFADLLGPAEAAPRPGSRAGEQSV